MSEQTQEMQKKEAARKRLIDKLKAEKKRIEAKKQAQQKKETVGEVKIPGISKPDKVQAKDGKDGNGTSHATKPVATGPKGGQYVVSGTGKRQYIRSDKTRTFHRINKSEEAVKSMIDEIASEEKYINFIEDFKKGKAETAPSLKPPKEWWDKMKAKGLKDAVIGDIWYNKMSGKDRSAKRKAEGKKYGKVPKK